MSFYEEANRKFKKIRICQYKTVAETVLGQS